MNVLSKCYDVLSICEKSIINILCMYVFPNCCNCTYCSVSFTHHTNRSLSMYFSIITYKFWQTLLIPLFRSCVFYMRPFIFDNENNWVRHTYFKRRNKMNVFLCYSSFFSMYRLRNFFNCGRTDVLLLSHFRDILEFYMYRYCRIWCNCFFKTMLTTLRDM